MSKRSFGPVELTRQEVQERIDKNGILPTECALALGSYMGEWSHLELATGNLAAVVFGTEEFLGHMLADRIQPAPLRELLLMAASNYMKDLDYDRFVKLAARWQTASGVRNRLVHGQWQLNLYLDSDAVTYTRFSHIWDRKTAMLEADGSNEKSESLRNKRIYTVERIRQEAALIKILVNEMNQFTSECVLCRRSDNLNEYLDGKQNVNPIDNTYSREFAILINLEHIRGW